MHDNLDDGKKEHLKKRTAKEKKKSVITSMLMKKNQWKKRTTKEQKKSLTTSMVMKMNQWKKRTTKEKRTAWQPRWSWKRRVQKIRGRRKKAMRDNLDDEKKELLKNDDNKRKRKAW